MRNVYWPAALHRITEARAMPAGKQPSCAIEFGNCAATVHAVRSDITDKPGPLAAEATRRPANRHNLFHRLPVLAMRSGAIVKRDSLSATVNLNERRRAALIEDALGQ